jgi:hypothetical protein
MDLKPESEVPTTQKRHLEVTERGSAFVTTPLLYSTSRKSQQRADAGQRQKAIPS